MRAAPIAVILLAAAAGASANADQVVGQKDKTFAPGAVTVAAGETLKVTNDDPVLHHVYVDAPNMQFDSGEQQPGQTISIVFKKPGEYVAQCAIHPKMKLNVTVK